MNFSRRFKQESSGFQMGPMLDIIFILMIQFMVATVFSTREDWFNISVPTATKGSSQQEQVSEVVLNLRENGEMYLDRNVQSGASAASGVQMLKPSDWSAPEGENDTGAFGVLKGELAQLFSNNRDLKVIIRADRKSEHGRVVRLLDICAALNIRNVAFATQQP